MPVCARAEAWELLKRAAGATKGPGAVSPFAEIAGGKYDRSKDDISKVHGVAGGSSSSSRVGLSSIQLPAEGSAAWLENEAALKKTLATYGCTGILEVQYAITRVRIEFHTHVS